MRYVYDNSEANPFNPNSPPQRVRGGNRARDEMAHLWLQVLPVNVDPTAGDPRMSLQEALARHNIENDPANFESHYNLAAMLQAKGKTDEAIAEYEAALRIRPQDATANNALGGAFIGVFTTVELNFSSDGVDTAVHILQQHASRSAFGGRTARLDPGGSGSGASTSRAPSLERRKRDCGALVVPVSHGNGNFHR